MLGFGALCEFALCEWELRPVPAGISGQTGTGRKTERRSFDPWAKTLSKRHYRELEELLAAERALADKADAAPVASQEALNAAADEAREAAEAMAAANAGFVAAQKLTSMLRAAVNASNTKQAIELARLAHSKATAILAEIEDEEDALMMLLSHDG